MMNIKSTITCILMITIVLSITGSQKGDCKMDNHTSTDHQIKGVLPGIEDFPEFLKKKFAEKKKYRGETYKPRTKHIDKDGWATYTNRLFLESSPYLLQHAHNPVNWYSWGDEAFETAKKLNRPVLVSIGYSTCHWCHVMEEESFEDVEIAQYLNEHFIAVKVDREERPDIDSIYMTALQAMTGGGGWPLNVWLTPERRPFYGGTYFPARDGDRGAGAGFFTILKKLNEVYHTQPDKVAQSSSYLTKAIRDMLTPSSGTALPNADSFHAVVNLYRKSYDPVFGGLNGAPKFPSSLPVGLLLRYYRRTGDKSVLEMAEHTLEKMAAGGMYDHVGGGFHRYSVDEKWLVPHFEKMLYDNALLAVDYIEAFQVTGRQDFKRVAEEILHYVTKEMISPDGVFYSASDADSLTPEGHREEGYFFTWTHDELETILGKARAAIISKYYSVGDVPNFEGRHILHRRKSVENVAGELKISEKELDSIIEESRDILYQERNRRPLPLRDDKVLTSWNGLMISAYARAGFVLGDQKYIDIASRASRFILDHLYVNGRLHRSYKDGKAKNNGYLQDYAFFIASLLDLYEASHDSTWLKKAIELDAVLENQYEDKENGGFFLTSEDHEELIAREKPGYDGAIPSGNSVTVLNLLRLYELTTRADYLKRSENALKTFLGSSSSNPAALSRMLMALDFYLDKPKEIIIITPEGKEADAERFLAVLRSHFIPNSVLTIAGEGEKMESLSKLILPLKGKSAVNGRSTAYVCEGGFCRLPAGDPADFEKQISIVEMYDKTVD